MIAVLISKHLVWHQWHTVVCVVLTTLCFNLNAEVGFIKRGCRNMKLKGRFIIWENVFMLNNTDHYIKIKPEPSDSSVTPAFLLSWTRDQDNHRERVLFTEDVCADRAVVNFNHRVFLLPRLYSVKLFKLFNSGLNSSVSLELLQNIKQTREIQTHVSVLY